MRTNPWYAAHVIATRGVGTQGVNDPLLKSLNIRLLEGSGVLDWRAFWQGQRQHFGGSALFSDYIFPDRDNGSAFLRAYYRIMEE